MVASETDTASKTNNSTNISQAISEQKSEQKKEVNIPKKNVVKQERKPVKAAPKIGLHNRMVYNVHVVLKSDDFILAPNQSSTKIYKEDDIKSVQGVPLKTAIAQGIISILR